MKKLSLVYAPDSKLREISKPVEKVNEELVNLMDNMLNTMYKNNGIGLAGAQVGVLKRIVVIDVCDKDIDSEDETKKRNPRFLINPEILWRSSEKFAGEEGCLSVPNQRAIITRPEQVKIQYLDRNEKQQTLEATGLLAKCIQHEIDHLNGKLFIDYLSKLKRDQMTARAQKFLKTKEETK